MMDLGDPNPNICLWAGAMNTENYLRNRIYRKACNESDKRPFEVLMSKRPNRKHLRRYASKALITYLSISGIARR